MKQTYDIAKKVIKWIKTNKILSSIVIIELIINLAIRIETLFLEWKRVWSGQTLLLKSRDSYFLFIWFHFILWDTRVGFEIFKCLCV